MWTIFKKTSIGLVAVLLLLQCYKAHGILSSPTRDQHAQL